MTTIPVELANARRAAREAWEEFQIVIDRDHSIEEWKEALHKGLDADTVAHELYERWQALGGTSDIESIVEAEFSLADKVAGDLQPKRLSLLPDPRIAQRESILAILRDEPVTKEQAHEYFEQLAEIDADLQIHPSDTCNDYVDARWDKMEEIKF